MPTTDWQLVRHLLAAAVDACGAAEQLGLTDAVTDAAVPASGGPARSLRAQVEALASWYGGHMVPQLGQAAAGRSAA